MTVSTSAYVSMPIHRGEIKTVDIKLLTEGRKGLAGDQKRI